MVAESVRLAGIPVERVVSLSLLPVETVGVAALPVERWMVCPYNK